MNKSGGKTKLAILATILLLLLGGLYFRPAQYFPPLTTSTVTRQSEVPVLRATITVESANEIAVAEVKRREGWSGIATNRGIEGGTYYIFVRRNSDPTSDWRRLSLVDDSGEVCGYEVRTDQID